jgi:N-acetylmuramoyl-L-alanine amidase
VRDSRLYVVQHATCPAVLVECGYLTHAEEARRLKRDDYKEKLAAAIAESVRHYLIATSFNPRRGFSARPSGPDVAAGGS